MSKDVTNRKILPEYKLMESSGRAHLHTGEIVEVEERES